jgi:hypothetical protein
LSIRVLSFEHRYPAVDLHYEGRSVETFAAHLRKQFAEVVATAAVAAAIGVVGSPNIQLSVLDINGHGEDENEPDDDHIDPLQLHKRKAIEALRADPATQMRLVSADGVAWGSLKAFLKGELPETLEDRDEFAFKLVREAMEEILGPQDVGWHTYRRTGMSGRATTYVRKGVKPSD